jgi:hypothetical protein
MGARHELAPDLRQADHAHRTEQARATFETTGRINKCSCKIRKSGVVIRYAPLRLFAAAVSVKAATVLPIPT